MSLNDFSVDQHQFEMKHNVQILPTSSIIHDSHVDNSMECNSTPHKRRRQTNQALEALGHLIKDSVNDDIEEKLNKNDILSLTISRLLRRKYNPSTLINPNISLAHGFTCGSLDEQINGFLFVVNTQGRIIFISDNAEYYLRKNVRALYSQLTSIYQCIGADHHESFRQILNRPTTDEQRVICSWHLPRGKRPSRTHSESRTMLISGHHIYLQADKRQDQQEALFIARCEQILSSTPNIPSNSLGVSSPTTLRLVLNDQFQLNEISTNTQTILGYSAEQLMDQSLKRFVPTDYWTLLDDSRDKCFVGQHCTIMNVIDFYTSNGDRLTFLCNMHTLIENRRKALKFGFLAQLIDPSIRDECVAYANRQNVERLKSTVQTESLLLTNIYGTTPAMMMEPSPPMASHDQYLASDMLSNVCPATVIPQRRKRRRVATHQVKTEELSPLNEIKTEQLSMNNNDFNNSLSSGSDNSISSASPMQEIASTDGFLPFYDEMFPPEKLKLFPDCPLIDEFSDWFSFGSNPMTSSSSLFLTPTLATCSFFA